MPISGVWRPVAQRVRNPPRLASAQNLYVWRRPVELWCATSRLQLNFHCGRRLNDVAAFVPMKQCGAGHSSDTCNDPLHRLAEVARPAIRSQHHAVFA